VNNGVTPDIIGSEHPAASVARFYAPVGTSTGDAREPAGSPTSTEVGNVRHSWSSAGATVAPASEAARLDLSFEMLPVTATPPPMYDSVAAMFRDGGHVDADNQPSPEPASPFGVISALWNNISKIL